MSGTYPETGAGKVASCNFCNKLLGKEYYFECHICGATYCYLHMTKHSRAHKPKLPVPVSN